MVLFLPLADGNSWRLFTPSLSNRAYQREKALKQLILSSLCFTVFNAENFFKGFISNERVAASALFASFALYQCHGSLEVQESAFPGVYGHGQQSVTAKRGERDHRTRFCCLLICGRDQTRWIVMVQKIEAEKKEGELVWQESSQLISDG